jgi:1,4-dihydroxy-6-naphthoate synthase
MTDPGSQSLTLGFSPCPNDTFIFHRLVHGLADELGLNLAPPELADVETLNEWAMIRRLDITKISFHALGHVLDDYTMLHSGAALGRGCGPVLVAKDQVDSKKISNLRIAIPGKYTTAAMLLRLYDPSLTNLVPMRFDEIMGSIVDGRVDAGVIIHESRFTYPEYGLVEVIDLGKWWEQTTDLPIPLGCIAARRDLGEKMIRLVEKGILMSAQLAFKNPDIPSDYIKSHAQEMNNTVIQDHISLYVNNFSLELGDEGLKAISVFWDRGREAGIIPPGNSRPLF